MVLSVSNVACLLFGGLATLFVLSNALSFLLVHVLWQVADTFLLVHVLWQVADNTDSSPSDLG
jgi:hypothetical protein